MRGSFARTSTLTAALLLTLAACGSDAAVDETTTTAPAETTTTTAAEGSGDTEAPDAGGSMLCLEATQAMAAAMSSYGAGFAGAAAGNLDEESLEEAAEQLQAMAGAAPDEIRDDLEVIADELEAFYSALSDIGYEPGATPTEEQMAELAEVVENMDDEAFQEASDNIEAWFDANC